ncbi:acyl carrier protein [Shivajiella indica]|uniref:Acyl carrier protein n=1 Tax=Shivajiella indica TaxID=872115 RepID=A0ABW5B7C0_9BACT
MENKFLEELKEILEIEDRDLSVNDKFREYPEWDSLANLSVIAMIDEEFGVVIENSEFRKIQTLGELIEEIKKRIN